MTVHVLTAQSEIGRWMGEIGAIWGFNVVVSASVEAVIAQTLPGRADVALLVACMQGPTFTVAQLFFTSTFGHCRHFLLSHHRRTIDSVH